MRIHMDVRANNITAAVGIVIMIMLSVLLDGCDHKRHLEPYHWEITEPEFDSISVLLESEVLSENHPSYMERHLLQLDSLVRTAKSARGTSHDPKKINAMRGRLMFWQAVVLGANHSVEADSIQYLLASALEGVDSLDYPYHYRRLIDEKVKISATQGHPDILPLLRSCDFYDEIGDYRMHANALVSMGNIMNIASQPILALRFHRMADSIYTSKGLTLNLAKNRLNIAQDLMRLGQHQQALSLLERIKTDTIVRNNIRAFYFLNLLLYESIGDVRYLKKAHERVEGRIPELSAACEALMSDFYRKRGILSSDVDSADYFSQLAFAKIDSVTDEEDRKIIWMCEARRLENAHKWDSAVWAWNKYNVESENHRSSIHADQIAASHYFHDVARLQFEKEKSDYQNKYLIVLIILVIISLSSIGTFVVYKHRKTRQVEIERYKADGIRAQLEAERHRRELMALTLANEESGKRLSVLKSNIETLATEGKIEKSDLRKLKLELIELTDTQSEWEKVIELFKRSHPHFIPNLYKISPGITTSQIKLATLIFTGLSIKQISSYLNVRPESVMQARWRLKNKLHIGDDESLESALIRINSENQHPAN